GAAAIGVALVLLFVEDHSAKVRWTFGGLAILFWLGGALAARERVIRPLQTLSNLVAALREGDYSVRGRHARREDALGEVLVEVNALSEVLQGQRLGELEAQNLLAK